MTKKDVVKSLKWRALQGSGVIAASHALSQVIRLGSNLILTRILAPEMFGVMAIATVVLVAVSMMSDIGVKQYVIKCPEAELTEVLDTAWVIQIVRGFALCGLVLGISALLSLFQYSGVLSETSVYGSRDLPQILAAFSLLPILSGVQSTKQYVLNRRINVLRLQSLELANQIIAVAVTVFLAFYLKSVWALVWGSVLGGVLSTIFSHVFIPGHRHRLVLKPQKTHEIFNFTKWIFLSSIMGFVTNNSDKLWFGLLMTPEQLGVYAIGFNLAYAFKAIFEKLSVSIILPSLCEVDRENPQRLVDVYYKIRMLVDPALMFGAGLIFSIGPSLVSALYDERYSQAGDVVRILSISIVAVCFLLGNRYLVSRGLVKERAWVTFAEAISVNLFIAIFYIFFGITGAYYGLAVSPIIPIIVLFFVLRKKQMLSLLKELRFLFFVVPGVIAGLILNKYLLSLL